MNARPFCILALVVMPIDLQLKNNVIENVVFSGIKMFAIWKWTADPVLEGLWNGECFIKAKFYEASVVPWNTKLAIFFDFDVKVFSYQSLYMATEKKLWRQFSN